MTVVDRPVVIVSNRGPASFVVGPDGELEMRRGSGGLVTGLAALGGSDATWIAAAIGEGDVARARLGPTEAAGFDLRLLEVDADRYGAAYDVVANETLWFLHHGLWDLTREPRFDDRWRSAWAHYRALNEQFAEAVAESAPRGSVVLVQDYHLSLMGHALAERRPDLTAVHFHHTPFCTPHELETLPDDVAHELMDGLGGYASCGFHTDRWARHFAACADHAPPTFVAPLGIDPAVIASEAATDACRRELARLDELVGDRWLLARVDRIELSKNLLRGFDAFDLLLERRPDWRGRVVFGAFCYPSRGGVAAYASYRREVEERVAALNERWGTPAWTPVLWEDDDNYPRSVAALRRADGVLVNPVRDGLNLVAKEAALVNEHDAGIVLSDRAGSWAELRHVVEGINPFDVAATASALERVLDRPPEERRRIAAAAREVAAGRTPADWLADQLAAAGD